MKFDVTKIIPFDALKDEIASITNKINKNDELLVLENNEPQFLVMSLDRYNYLVEIEQIILNSTNNKIAEKAYDEQSNTDYINDIDNTYEYNDLSDKRIENPKVKIGVLAKDGFRKLAKEKRISASELNLLCNMDYSKREFNMNYPVLKKVNSDISIEIQKRDNKGYNRYYNFILMINNEEYLLVSQWVENLHRKELEKWFRKKGI